MFWIETNNFPPDAPYYFPVEKQSAIQKYRWLDLIGERFNLMENTSGLDLAVGLLAFAILGGGLAMLFVGMASFPKEK